MKFGSQLTDEQLEERRKGIGASDAAKILAGGEAWHELWLDKTGRAKPKRIMGEWDAALRHVTEGLQCDWYEHKTGNVVACRGEQRIYGPWTVLRCTLDGLMWEGYPGPADAVFECKHVSHWTPDPIKWAIEKYTPQIQHQMIVCGTDKAIMSVMVGMNQPELVNFTLDPFFGEVYIERCKEFWRYVETDTPPPGLEAVAAPVIPIEEMKVVSFQESNEWGDWAQEWSDNKSAAKKFEKASSELKKMVPADAREAMGHGIKIVRSKAGALTIKSDD